MYFPWSGFFETLLCSDIFIIYDDVQFARGFFNRVQIKTEYGSSWLTVPLVKHTSKNRINEVLISYEEDWKVRHLNQLLANYRGAKYLNEMLHLVEMVYSHDYHVLSELAVESTRVIANYFNIKPRLGFQYSSELNIEGRGSERILRICKKLGATVYISGHGGRNYLEHQTFEDNNIEVEYMRYNYSPRDQLHGDFTPFVSCLDLIANCGRNGVAHLSSNTISWRNWNEY